VRGCRRGQEGVIIEQGTDAAVWRRQWAGVVGMKRTPQPGPGGGGSEPRTRGTWIWHGRQDRGTRGGGGCEYGAGMGAGKKEVVAGMGGGTGARVESYICLWAREASTSILN
jgi:hypothetical protein